jgi:hypothetical protein
MDSDWPFNFNCVGLPKHLSPYYDLIILPEVFYQPVIERNTQKINNLIKYYPILAINIISFYNITLLNAFLFKLNAKFGMPYKIPWKTKNTKKIILNFNEQVDLYKYITTAPWKFTNMGFLINCINNYLVLLRQVMTYINKKIPVPQFYYLGVNVTNNDEMKFYISKFIPGILQRIKN